MSKQQLTVPRCRVRAWHLGASPYRPVITLNDALPWWGYVLGKAISEGGYTWRVRKLYIEYENVATSSTPAAIPTIDPMNPDHALAYYESLLDSPTRGYLRVDLRGTPAIDPETGYEDYFPAGTGNLLTFFAQTVGTTGENGLAFSDVVNSKVCGTALVVAPVENDPSQDIVVARAYFDEEDQLLKTPGMQIGVSWEAPFVLPS